MKYVAMCMVFFDGDAPNSDAWAKGNAEWIVNNTEALAAQSALVSPGLASERQSYAAAYEIGPDGTLTPTLAWHQTASGPVDGLPSWTPPPPPPSAWAANTAYTVGSRVSYLGINYACIQGHTSQVGWEPPNVPALWSVTA